MPAQRFCSLRLFPRIVPFPPASVRTAKAARPAGPSGAIRERKAMAAHRRLQEPPRFRAPDQARSIARLHHTNVSVQLARFIPPATDALPSLLPLDRALILALSVSTASPCMAEACVRTVPMNQKSIASVAGPAPFFDRWRPYSISLSRVSRVRGTDPSSRFKRVRAAPLERRRCLP